ncbi:MAG: helix-turn-helix domain-containing protein [Solirubrobacteraceae bacterium]
MLDGQSSSKLKVSTGIDELDTVLGELYWGDNVVWEVDGAQADPFYAAIGSLAEEFDMRAFVSIGGSMPVRGTPDLTLIEAGPGTALPQPADLLREIQRLCHAPSRRLLMFDSLDQMVRAWGVGGARAFFSRCCPFLLDAGAIAYWNMSVQQTPAVVRDTVYAVTQCILRVDDSSVRVAKAEGREQGVTGSMLHWHLEDGRPILDEANVTGRVAASLRSLRRVRGLSQQDLAGLAGVTASAVSQAERAERGLSLSTLARLSASLGITIDDLLRGENPDVYRIGRRPEDPQHHAEDATTLLGSPDTEVQIDLVQLAPRQDGAPAAPRKGSGIVAVASGLVQIEVAGQTPAVRRGEVLVADSERIERWRNVGHGEALLFWIVLAAGGPFRPHRPRS